MKVILIANVSANGQIGLAGNPKHVGPPETFGFIVQNAVQAGNIIVGRKTLEVLQQFPGGPKQIFPGVEIVVVSSTKNKSDEFKVVESPEQAVSYLKGKDFENIIVAGGAQIYNAFLEKDLVTDVYFNIIPIIIGDGGTIGTSKDLYVKFARIEQKLLIDNVIQIHLSKT